MLWLYLLAQVLAFQEEDQEDIKAKEEVLMGVAFNLLSLGLTVMVDSKYDLVD